MNSIYYTFLDFGTIWMCDYISHSCLLIFVCLRICFHGAPRRGFQVSLLSLSFCEFWDGI